MIDNFNNLYYNKSHTKLNTLNKIYVNGSIVNQTDNVIFLENGLSRDTLLSSKELKFYIQTYKKELKENNVNILLHNHETKFGDQAVNFYSFDRIATQKLINVKTKQLNKFLNNKINSSRILKFKKKYCTMITGGLTLIAQVIAKAQTTEKRIYKSNYKKIKV
jgi:rRNA pseudouridine-1189 N-methylase Emg1 (Nep1/Mra1 family)